MRQRLLGRRRNRFASLVIALACSSSILTGFAPTAVAQNCVPAASRGDVGIASGGLLGLPLDQLNREMAAMKQAGISSVRFDIDWSIIERNRGQFDWSSSDRVTIAAYQAGITPIGLITYTPRWARAADVSGDNPHGRPADPAVFGYFAAQAANRYNAFIKTFEIWNEPNLTNFWAPKPDFVQYSYLMAQSYVQMKNVNPSVKVISGGLSPAVDSGGNISPTTFLDGMYRTGARPYFDILGVHPYSWPALPSDASTAAWNTFYRMRNLHDIMVRNGDSGKKIWGTEFGAPTGTAGDAVTEQRQAAIISDGIKQIRQLGYVEKLFVYQMRDMGTNRNDREQNFGLVRYDFSPKPALGAMTALTLLRTC